MEGGREGERGRKEERKGFRNFVKRDTREQSLDYLIM